MNALGRHQLAQFVAPGRCEGTDILAHPLHARPFLHSLRFVMLICEEETDSEGEEFLWGHTARKLSAWTCVHGREGPSVQSAQKLVLESHGQAPERGCSHRSKVQAEQRGEG